jgi:sarcosine oxidase subunit beta
MRVVVVGGGIVGMAAAYYLRERGADVVVCERGSVGGGRGSTERSAGGIRAQFTTPVNVEFSLASMAVWERFEEAFGVDVGYRRPGYLFLAREESTADALADAVEMQAERGVPSDLLSPAEATERCPELHAESFVAASYAPTDGFADPGLALRGFAEAAREAGVDIRTKTPVEDVRVEGGRAAGVVADGDRIDADAVVNAAGPWGGEVASMAGLDLPVSPRRREVLVVDPSRPVPEDVPLTIDLDTGSYFRPEREGNAIVGGHFADSDPAVDPDRYAESVGLDYRATALERASDVAGYFGPDSRVRRGWAGLYAVTPDRHGIVEESLPGFVNAVGFSGHGFQHAPATGQVVAELLVDGAASTVDPTPLSADRFEDEGATTVERNVA